MIRPLVALLLFAARIPGADAGLVYTIEDSSPGGPLFVSLRLPPSSGVVRRLATRGAAWGLKEHVRLPKCDGVPLRRDGSGSWVAPASCHEVTWFIVPEPVRDGSVDVSKQATLAFEHPRWTLLSEPTSLLRLQGEEGAARLAAASTRFSLIGATPLPQGGWRIPATNNAPEFFVIGNASSVTRVIGVFRVRYIADDAERVASLGLESLHESALRFLVRVVPSPQALGASERSLLVVWVGVNQSTHHAGGAAGSRSVLANYVTGMPQMARLNAARTLLVIAHEQFHQLADLARGPRPSLPVWLDESLAQYYALKALEAAMPGEEAQAIRARFIDPTRPVAQGLVELDRRYRAGDRTVYPAFYEQGATFWAELDQVLLEKSGGETGLDALIPRLLIADMEKDGELAPAFVERARAVGGPKILDLLAKYVGG